MKQRTPKDRGTALGGSSPPEDLKDTVSAVLHELSRSGDSWSLDRLKRLRDAGIIGDAVPRPGYGNLRFYEKRDICRLHAINELHRRFGLRKLSKEEVAFWLAADGDADMPARLVLSHIEAMAKSVSGYGANIMARRAGARHLIDYETHPDTIRRLSKSFFVVVGRGLSHGIESTQAYAVRIMLEVFLTKMLRTTRYEAAAKKIKAMLRALGASAEQADTWARQTWEAVEEVGTFVMMGERNAFVQAARSSVVLPGAEIARAASHAGMFHALLLAGIPVFGTSGIERQLVPLTAGMLLHFREHAPTMKVRSRFDKGDLEKFRYDLTILGRVVTPFLENIRNSRIRRSRYPMMTSSRRSS